MYWEVTFSEPTQEVGGAHALDVDLLRLAELAAVLALCHRATFLFDLEERAVGVFAGG